MKGLRKIRVETPLGR